MLKKLFSGYNYKNNICITPFAEVKKGADGMGISPISGFSNNQNTVNLIKLATMKRINSAADDAAGLAISKKMESTSNAYEVGSRNIKEMSDLSKTADSAMGNIQEHINKIKELSVQAANGTLSESDKGALQKSIEGQKEAIGKISKSAEYNTQKLLDGTFTNKSTATDGSGGSTVINIADMSLEALGLADFDVTKSFDLSTLDDAMTKVSSERSKVGASMNRFDHAVALNTNASQNLKAAQSRIEDADIAKETIQLNINKAIQQYKYFASASQNAMIGSQMNIAG